VKKRKAQVSTFYCDANSKKHILLLQMNETRGSFWQNITGGVEDGESFLDGAKREFFEETQISLDKVINITKTELTFEFQDTWNNDCIEECYLFELKDHEMVKIDPNEHQNYKWVCEDNINSSCVKYPSNYDLIMEALK
jgi:8-oxo-dGTP pyrophosphatase MutT (NUDIX family)